jgi:superfamily II DNA or RNA helicase
MATEPQPQPLTPVRDHQKEAVVATVPRLELPAGEVMPPQGLRAQVVKATGSGKTLTAVHIAHELGAARVLVLMPSRPLLTQTAAAWRLAGRPGPAIGVSSLRQADVGFPNTTNPAVLARLLKEAGDGPVTVYGTYASLGTIEQAHQLGLPPWDLIVVDEAHRTSGRMGKPWALVHDNARIPATARLYMTATPRLWAAGEPDPNGEADTESGTAGEVVASMEDDPNGTFGAVTYRLTLAEAIDRGIVAPYQVLCIEIQDPHLQTLQLAADGDATEAVRAARLAALQTAAHKAAAEHDFKHVLTFHSRLDEAEAFSDGLHRMATALWKEDPVRYPHPDTVWTSWLSGDHKADHRSSTLRAFAADREGPAFLSSVKVLGEGVDTRECDAVFFADVRGSMPDLVQAVGRALRMHPGEGKLATIAVPIILGAGESPDELLTSPAYAPLAKLLTALRAHDSRIIEALASPSTPSRPSPTDELAADNEPAADAQDDTDEDDGADDTVRELLSFSTAHDPRQIAAFIGMRVLNPEKVHWRRGIQAATRYLAEHDDLRVPYVYRTPDDWSPADYPLGVFIADLRRYYHEGTLDPERIEQAEKLGMIWSEFDAAFEEGVAAATAWAADHPHVGLAAPTDAMHGDYPVGKFLSNQRAAARRAEILAHHQAEGTTPPASSITPLPDRRRQVLEDIDSGWCPPWPIDWQRHFRLAWHHLQTGGTVPAKAGELVIDGADIGKWLAAQARSFAKLTVTQQWMLTGMLRFTPAPAPRKISRAEQRELNLTAARQFHAREGHLDVPRSHREPVDGTDVGLGAWINNVRARQASQPEDLKEELTTLGMRWA